MSIKVAVIGAGSITFTRRLMSDILTVPELRDTRFAFTDINKRNLDMATRLARRDERAYPSVCERGATKPGGMDRRRYREVILARALSSHAKDLTWQREHERRGVAPRAEDEDREAEGAPLH